MAQKVVPALEPEYTGDGEAPGDLESIRSATAEWRARRVAQAEAKVPPRQERFSTWSGLDVPALLTPADVPVDYLRDLGLPGQYPFTRGVQPTMYRGRLWTMRMFAGFGTPEQTNERFKYLLAQGQTGLSTAFDFPTLMGYDSDSPRALGEVGMCGVAVDTLRDMEVLFADIPLDQVTTSMTINGPAIVLFAFYVALADARGIPRERIGGTVQNDCLKEFIAQHAWLVPPRPAMRVVTDMIEFGAREVPRWNTVSISGYHIREAGATAAQELAFTLADGIAYVQAGVERGLARRRLRAAPLVLLRRAQRLLRGDREVPRRAPPLGADHEGALRREEAGEHEAPHARADGGRVADRAAAAQQRRARRHPGAGRGARRHAVAPHELARRDVRAADRGRRDDRAPDAADHRRGERRREHDRPARRVVLRRGPHAPPRGRGDAVHPPHRRDGRHGRAPSRRATPSARSRRAPTASSARSSPASA